MNLLVTDYDNTYEIHYECCNKEEIFNKNKNALQKFSSFKNIVGIATGRHFDAMYETIKNKNIQFDYLCCNNAAEIYDKNYNILFTIPIDNNDLIEIKKIESYIDVYYRTPYNRTEITSINMYFNSIDKYEYIKMFLKNNLISSYIEFKYPKIKIINSMCDKVIFVDLLCKKLNLDPKKIYTIGDEENDIKMIKKYNGCSLNGANNNVKKCAKKIYNSLDELVYEIIDIDKRY